MSSTAKLQVLTNDKFRKSFKTSCTVKMDKGVDTFEDFVTVGYNEQTGTTTMLKNADAVTLGKAALMVAAAFRESLEGLSPAMREEVLTILEGTD
jgi:hypothetical protein